MKKEDDLTRLEELARRIRYQIIEMTTNAGSGHPSSALSATDLLTGLFFGGHFRFFADRPEHPNNDRLVFSKGHASPLLYALWAAAGKVTPDELATFRKFGSRLEGHAAAAFPYAEATTGSLGQGLSIGLGMALNARYLDELPYRTFVLLGDGEMTEGSQWEAIQIAAHYRLDNLIGIIDVNRLGQTGETLYGHDLDAFRDRISAFGWETLLIDGHAFPEILSAFERVARDRDRPLMIIAKTLKGKGISLLEDRNGWHGKVLSEAELETAKAELGAVDTTLEGTLAPPEDLSPEKTSISIDVGGPEYPPDLQVPTRKAFGNALKRIFLRFPDLVSLDGEVGNSTCAEVFKEAWPGNFFEMYIAEQNMTGAALGLSLRGKIPFVSSFAAFLTRAFDQIRMCRYSNANIKFVGSHAGVTIGEDGPSQMGLEDIAMFRTILDATVLYPSDAVSTERLVEAAAEQRGIVYIRTTRMATPILYSADETFPIGGLKVLRRSTGDAATVVAAGVTLHEALKAFQELAKEGVRIRVIDLYSIKPIDAPALQAAAEETGLILTVEDHYAEGGIGEAVRSALAGINAPVHSLAVRKKPVSGTSAELLAFEEISMGAIAAKVRSLIGR